MTRKRRRNRYKTPNEIQRVLGNRWYTHYYQYLTSLAYQLFEWENLPDSVDPRYMELSLHGFGWVGFYKDPEIGYVAVQGSPSGQIDNYLLPTTYNAVTPNYQKTFPLYNYKDTKEEGMGVCIWNNDYHFSTLPSMELFAMDLAEVKEIIHVNMNAQKTPIMLYTDDETKLSMMQAYNQIEGNAPYIVANKNFDPNNVQAINMDAPYVVDKLNQQKNAVWNEVMTYLGIKNANQEKKERMITAEADSNNEQVTSSANIFLKSRLEACEKINDLYGLNLNVRLRNEIVEEIEGNITPDPMIPRPLGGEQNE